MLTVEEKKNLISSIISFPIETIDQLSVQKQLHEMLLRDTVGGKLYKYRAFDSKGHSLRNLKAGTLHCSSAASFNDPFDCKIGVTFQSLYEAKYKTEFDLICGVLEKFVRVVQKEISIADCSEDERRVIAQLMKRERLMRFCSRISTEEELDTLLKANAVIVLELLQGVLEDQKLSPSLGVCATMLPQLLANITENGMLQLSKEDRSIKDFAIANGITEDVDEVDLTVLLSNKLNPDLANAATDINNLIEEWDRKISCQSAELFQIGCLCTNPKNRLMWSHYADGHKGFCVEYDFFDPSERVLATLPFPVIYSDKRPLIPWGAAFEKTPENMEAAWRQIMLGLLTKDSQWAYENEWRIFVRATDPADLKMPRISCIYLGVTISDENRDKILKIASEKMIPVKQMTVDRGEYELHAQNIFPF